MVDMLVKLQAASEEYLVFPTDWFWSQIETMTLTQAIMLVCFGVVYLVNGWRIFSVLTVVTSGLLGVLLGVKVGAMMHIDFWPPIVGFFVMALLAIPFIHLAIGIFGGVCISVIAGSVWHAMHLPDGYLWIIMAVALVVGLIVSLKLFRLSVTIFTSYFGAVMMGLGMLYLALYIMQARAIDSDPFAAYIQQQWFLPVYFLAIAACGFLVQFSFVGKLFKRKKDDDD